MKGGKDTVLLGSKTRKSKKNKWKREYLYLYNGSNARKASNKQKQSKALVARVECLKALLLRLELIK